MCSTRPTVHLVIPYPRDRVIVVRDRALREPDDHTPIHLLGSDGQLLRPSLEQALLDLMGKFQRHFPSIRDELSLIEIFEEAGRRIEQREQRAGPIARLHPYAWVTLKSVAASRLRRGAGRLAQRIVSSEDAETALDLVPAGFGAAADIESRILLREVLEVLTPHERLVCLLKRAGHSSREIAERRGSTAAAVDTLWLRVRQRVRRQFGMARARWTQHSSRLRVAAPASRDRLVAQSPDGGPRFRSGHASRPATRRPAARRGSTLATACDQDGAVTGTQLPR